MAQQKPFKTWDQYTEEAKHDPFELPVSDDYTIVVEAPTGASLIQWARAMRTGDMQAMLITVCGDKWSEVEPLLSKAGHAAFENLLVDMMVFFDLTEDVTLVGPGGGKVIRKDPREIRAMMKQGYRPEGEADSRT